MRFWQVPVGPMKNFAYLLAPDLSDDAILVDPGFEGARLVELAKHEGLRIAHVLVTHGHPDHIGAVAQVKKLTGARVAAHERADHPVDDKLVDGETRTLAGLDVRVVHTPGHRFDCACFLVEGTHLLTGDTLFVGECGRVDLPGGDVGAMHHALLTTLAELTRALIVCPGHDYGTTPLSTLDEQFRTNYVLRPRTRDEFVRFMAEP